MTATPTAVTYERFEGQGAADQLDTFMPAYEEVYAEPPYREGPTDVALFVRHYQAHVQRPGMRLALAREGDEVVGFAYGLPLAADAAWWHGVPDLHEDFTREDGARTFAVFELAVRRKWRRSGVAGRLHALLRDGLAVERVTLAVRPEPEAKPAQSAYAKWGYREVGPVRPREEGPAYTVMVLDVPQPTG
ncbi:GNAT family N-acetyltransferase [Streptomyces sp. NPDC127068]|uniref:GNAT family N-acetyltransferase n=1 Tax=Streptomyces sp. NPDC127068 TaxID=3347127 RepID=UPI0036500887